MQASRAAKNVEAICRFRLRRSLRLDDRIVLALIVGRRTKWYQCTVVGNVPVAVFPSLSVTVTRTL